MTLWEVLVVCMIYPGVTIVTPAGWEVYSVRAAAPSFTCVGECCLWASGPGMQYPTEVRMRQVQPVGTTVPACPDLNNAVCRYDGWKWWNTPTPSPVSTPIPTAPPTPTYPLAEVGGVGGVVSPSPGGGGGTILPAPPGPTENGGT
jgi:hypothetical protein